MPDNKNQHYVPQFYLRNFASSESKRCINIFNIDRAKVILDASLRDQCSKGYFYGKDSPIDGVLTGLEGLASAEIRQLIEHETMKRASITLRLFISAQKGRTLYAAEQAYSLAEGIKAEIAKHYPPGVDLPQFPSKDEMKEINVRQHILLHPMLMDLSSALLVNGTGLGFISSDNPVTVCNRFHKDKHTSGIGLSRAGIEMYLPISPRLAVLLYDGNIWYAPDQKKDGTILINKTEEVMGVNEVQILNAQSNLYFSDWENADALSQHVEAIKKRRRSGDATVEAFFRNDDGAKDGIEKFTKIKEGTTGEMMLVGGMRDLDVAARVGFLKKSVRPKYFDDGSARGPIRDEAWSDIVTDFSSDVIKGKASIGDVRGYAKRHPLGDRILPRKPSATQI